MPTLLSYLTTPNPVLDSSMSLPGDPSENPNWEPVTGVKIWSEFNYSNLMACYGQVLSGPAQSILPVLSPAVTTFEKIIVDERSLDHLLSRSVMPEVNAAIEYARRHFYQQSSETAIASSGLALAVARAPDSRFYPDWAGVRMRDRGPRGFKNRCPGESKLSSKWKCVPAQVGMKEWERPFAQVQTYAHNNQTRYTYIITQRELVVARCARHIIAPGLASTRTHRFGTRSGGRGTGSAVRFAETGSEGTPSSQTTSSSIFQPDAGALGEWKAIEYRAIPWTNQGPGKLTVKLALWWLHMMIIDAPDTDIEIGSDYPPMDSYREVGPGKWQHTTTRLTTSTKPDDSKILPAKR